MNIFGLPPKTQLLKSHGFLKGRFEAMGCSCEILVESDDVDLARGLLAAASEEAWRIEKKFSRYLKGNIIDRINSSAGAPVTVDAETAQLLDFAERCFKLSDGLFDVTSGILRKAWRFDGKSSLPKKEDIEKLLPSVGWGKVSWKNPVIRMLPGMEIDLGGIGKEYAVDRTAQLMREKSTVSVLVNFGGDMAVSRLKKDGTPWVVGIEKPDADDQAAGIYRLNEGALATSGDSKKFVIANGRKLGHILNPLTGWPVEGAPRSVTVAATTCTEAGFFSTVGMLNGEAAESFLETAGVAHWCQSFGTMEKEKQS